jgi:hypothetical protein
MLWVVLSLVNPYIIYFECCRKVLTKPFGKATSTFWISTFVAFAAASIGAWLREAPGGGYSSVHQEVHRFTGYFCIGQLEIFTPDAIDKITIQIPLDVAFRSIVVWWFPFHAIFVIVPEVIFRQLRVGRYGIGLVRELHGFVLESHTVKEWIQLRFVRSVFQAFIPVVLMA